MASDSDDIGLEPTGATQVQLAPAQRRAHWSFDIHSDGTPSPVGALLALLGLGALNLTRRQSSRGLRA